MSRDPRAFVALDLGAATTASALIGRIAGRWRFLGALAAPAGVPEALLVGELIRRAVAADPDLADRVGVSDGAADELSRLTARSVPPAVIAVLAGSDRAVAELRAAIARTGWRATGGSPASHDPRDLTRMVLRPEVEAVLVGAGEPAGADERGSLEDLAALAMAAAVRRPELTVVLAGSMVEHQARFQAAAPQAAVVVAPGALGGRPPGRALAEVLDRLRARPDDSRAAVGRATLALAEALSRRIEVFEVGFNGGMRAVAEAGRGGEPGHLEAVVSADGALVPPDPDDAAVERVLGWSAASIDRYRLADRLRDLRSSPWADAAGPGSRLRLAAARAALGRLVAATPEFADRPVPDILVAAGGAFAVAPGPAVALALADVVRRPGVSQLAWDHARLLGPLGTIEDPGERGRLVADLADDLLAPLGGLVMPAGLRHGRPVGRLVVDGLGGGGTEPTRDELELVPGTIELVDLPPGARAVARFDFRDPVRLGGRGRHLGVEIAGGLGGVLVDLRDVPMRLPDRQELRRELLDGWQDALWADVEP